MKVAHVLRYVLLIIYFKFAWKEIYDIL